MYIIYIYSRVCVCSACTYIYIQNYMYMYGMVHTCRPISHLRPWIQKLEVRKTIHKEKAASFARAFQPGDGDRHPNKPLPGP